MNVCSTLKATEYTVSYTTINQATVEGGRLVFFSTLLAWRKSNYMVVIAAAVPG